MCLGIARWYKDALIQFGVGNHTMSEKDLMQAVKGAVQTSKMTPTEWSSTFLGAQ